MKDAGILRGDSSMEEKVVIILNEMSEYLSISQMKKLQEVILKTFSENEAKKQEISNHDFLKMFLDAKKIEGCSERTIQYYKVTVEHLLSKIEESVRKITTEEIRAYLADYQKWNNCSNVTIDNIRRNISSFFSWLEEYIERRQDNNQALFVTLDAPHDRLKISGVEIRLRQLGRRLDLERIHPHKFRRTMATRAIDKGMPIEQVQKILGHSQIDTTMQYAMVNQNNVKSSHQKYMS